MARSRYHSEFGGGTGRIAPTPHDFRASTSEQARLMRATDSTDPQDTEEAALVRERLAEGRSGTETEIRR